MFDIINKLPNDGRASVPHLTLCTVLAGSNIMDGLVRSLPPLPSYQHALLSTTRSFV